MEYNNLTKGLFVRRDINLDDPGWIIDGTINQGDKESNKNVDDPSTKETNGKECTLITSSDDEQLDDQI